MAQFYEFILFVELTEQVEKKSIQLANTNNNHRVKFWADHKTDYEDVFLREIVFESSYDIRNYLLQCFASDNVSKLIGFLKTPIYV